MVCATRGGCAAARATAVAFRIPLIVRIGCECDPVADQGAQEAAITEHAILSRTAEGETTRVQDFTGAARD
jgi:hypothetical protein